MLSGFMSEILKHINLSGNAEITAECNPCFITSETLREMKEAGINRISIGVQSLSDKELKAIGRKHNAKRAADSIIKAYNYGFDNISADLMLGIPGQTERSLSDTVSALIKLPLKHISAYMLKIEEGTKFGDNPPECPDEDLSAALYLDTVKWLKNGGFPQYEISNFSKKGFECRHNLKYWRLDEYIGIGPAAHSFFKGKRFFVPDDLENFIKSERQPEITEDDNPDLFEEKVMLGLRLNEGISESLYSPLSARLNFIPKRYYTFNNGKLALTPEGFLVSNSIISELLFGRNNKNG